MGGPEHRDRFGNPRDFKAYLSRLEGSARTKWQKPDAVVRALGLKRFLKPQGRLVNIDFHDRELPVGPPVGEKVGRDEFVAMARRAGYSVAAEHTFFEHQYFLSLAA